MKTRELAEIDETFGRRKFWCRNARPMPLGPTHLGFICPKLWFIYSAINIGAGTMAVGSLDTTGTVLNIKYVRLCTGVTTGAGPKSRRLVLPRVLV